MATANLGGRPPKFHSITFTKRYRRHYRSRTAHSPQIGTVLIRVGEDKKSNSTRPNGARRSDQVLPGKRHSARFRCCSDLLESGIRSLFLSGTLPPCIQALSLSKRICVCHWGRSSSLRPPNVGMRPTSSPALRISTSFFAAMPAQAKKPSARTRKISQNN